MCFVKLEKHSVISNWVLYTVCCNRIQKQWCLMISLLAIFPLIFCYQYRLSFHSVCIHSIALFVRVPLSVFPPSTAELRKPDHWSWSLDMDRLCGYVLTLTLCLQSPNISYWISFPESATNIRHLLSNIMTCQSYQPQSCVILLNCVG